MQVESLVELSDKPRRIIGEGRWRSLFEMPRVDLVLPQGLPPELAELIEAAPMPGLGAGPKCQATFDRVKNLLRKYPQFESSLTEAAIWLLAGELDRSHAISQGIESPEGAFWHGIKHRREGDFWNAKYWFRKVGKHAVFEQLAGQIQQLRSASNTESRAGNNASLAYAAQDDLWREVGADLSDATKLPTALVADCEKALASQSFQLIPLQRICWLEWQFLFHYGWD